MTLKKRSAKLHKALARIPAPVSDQQAFLMMIDRAARDPTVDVNKMKELLALRNQERKDTARQAYAAAMVACQDGMVPVKRNIQADRFRYASLEAVDAALRPLYSKAGFALIYDAKPINDKRVSVGCTVMHALGHQQEYSIPITVSQFGPSGTKAIMTLPQADGAAVSIGRRYLLLMIFNIITKEDDMAVSGNGASATPEQLKELATLIEKTKSDVGAMCEYLSIDSILDMPVKKYTEAVALLNTKLQRAK